MLNTAEDLPVGGTLSIIRRCSGDSDDILEQIEPLHVVAVRQELRARARGTENDIVPGATTQVRGEESVDFDWDISGASSCFFEGTTFGYLADENLGATLFLSFFEEKEIALRCSVSEREIYRSASYFFTLTPDLVLKTLGSVGRVTTLRFSSPPILQPIAPSPVHSPAKSPRPKDSTRLRYPVTSTSGERSLTFAV